MLNGTLNITEHFKAFITCQKNDAGYQNNDFIIGQSDPACQTIAMLYMQMYKKDQNWKPRDFCDPK